MMSGLRNMPILSKNPDLSVFREQKLSRLEVMRVDYQKRLMKEKEEKLIQMYEDNHKRAMDKMIRNGYIGSQNEASSTTSSKSVRGFFDERRRLEAGGHYMPPIHSHYRQAVGQSPSAEGPEGTGSDTSLKSIKNINSGIDRFQPMTPVRGPQQKQNVASGNIRQVDHQVMHLEDKGDVDKGLSSRSPRLNSRKLLPPTNGQFAGDNTDDVNVTSKLSQFWSQNTRSPQQHKRRPLQPDPTAEESNLAETLTSEKEDTLTDFQKWRIEQIKHREEKTKKLTPTMNANTDDKWNLSDVSEAKNRGAHSNKYIHDNDGSNGGCDIIDKEKELMEEIAQKQKELEKIRENRGKGEMPQVSLETERSNNKQTIRRNNQQKREIERKSEKDKLSEKADFQKRRTEGEKREEREERQREEREHNDSEERKRRGNQGWKEDQSKPENSENTFRDHEPSQISPHRADLRNIQKLTDSHKLQPLTKRTTNFLQNPANQNTFKSNSVLHNADKSPSSVTDVALYERATASTEPSSLPVDLVKCGLCGRSFAQDRLNKHQNACAKANKPRKKFDSSKKRAELINLP